MKWNTQKPTSITLLFLAIFSVAIFIIAERTAEPERQSHFDKKLEAAKISLLAREAIKNYSQGLGIKIDIQNDPYKTGLIGQERTPITTDRGIVTSKILATNPNFAAAFVDLLGKAKIKKKSIVAVGMTGSFPGLNISFLAACSALELEPLIITSVGSSDWGANLPQLTWLDMERVINERGVLHYKSVAATVGGGADNGRGLSPQGRDLLQEAIKRNNVMLIDELSLEKNIEKRVAVYKNECKGKPIACYINIGGGVASLGGSQNARLIPPGLTKNLAVKNYPVHAVINRMAEQGIPVINILNVEKIAEKFGFPTEILDKAQDLGEGPLFFKDKYSISNTILLTLFLAVVVFVVIKIDVRYYLFQKRNSPETL
jgi:poly-gamma-glutamate system protein